MRGINPAGLVGILIGVQEAISVHTRATIHGHYHPEDERALERAKATRQTGYGLLTGNEKLYDEAKAKLKKHYLK
jgi:hypothetical protein